MRILALIPARSGSKGVPGKNIKILGNKPLLQYSIDAALASKCFDKVLVSTESEKIKEIAISGGAEVPFLRPQRLAQDDSPTLDVVIDVIQQLSSKGEDFDAVCLLQPTVPFRKVEDLKSAIKKFMQSGADSLVSVRQIPQKYHPDWIYLEKEDGNIELSSGAKTPVPRRQSLSKAFARDGSIYITKTDVILNDNSLYGSSIVPFEIHHAPNINIDTFEDWENAESYLLSMPDK